MGQSRCGVIVTSGGVVGATLILVFGYFRAKHMPRDLGHEEAKNVQPCPRLGKGFGEAGSGCV